MLERAKKRLANTKKVKHIVEKERYLSCDQIEVGDFVSTDKYFSMTPDNLYTGYGRESSDIRFQGGTVYNDAASSLVWVLNQVSLGINETVMGKSRFEQWLWDQAAAEFSHYRVNNGIFNTTDYRHNCNKKGQTQFFPGFGAQHQNA